MTVPAPASPPFRFYGAERSYFTGKARPALRAKRVYFEEILPTGEVLRLGAPGSAPTTGWGQFGVGGLLGLVWLPCVGPTLGAAIGLASMGQSIGLAFLTMLAYGLGTGTVLLAAGLASRRALVRWRPTLIRGADRGRRLLGGLLLLLGILVLSGLDKRLEALAVSFVPEWALAF